MLKRFSDYEMKKYTYKGVLVIRLGFIGGLIYLVSAWHF